MSVQMAGRESVAGDEEEEACLGSTEVMCVGIQYYDGTVTNKEMVRLVREPENMYDNNAIRVENIRGEKVGHIERYKACHLAPLMDQRLIKLEGIIPRGADNKFKIPCSLFIFSRPSSAAVVSQRLRYGGLHLQTPSQGESSARQQKADGSGAGAAEEDAELSSMFDQLGEAEAVRRLMETPSALVSQLLDHQKEALAWMVKRENASSLPPFWASQAQRAHARTLYFNVLTNFGTDVRPPCVRGGILADDMGLGKTLTIIALIAANRPGAVLPPVSEVEAPAPEGPPAKKKRKQPTGGAARASKAAAAGSACEADVPDLLPSPQGPRCTLVVCPLSVMGNWTGQMKEHVAPSQLSWYVYHGSDRTRDVKVLQKHDVVVTTYSTLAHDGGEASPLQKVHWLRIVLDEAHTIRTYDTQQAQAALRLTAERRWAVTGTPIQNKIADLFSLYAFLRLEPLSDRSFWLRTIERPFKHLDPSGIQRLRLLIGATALRRTKDLQVNGRPIVSLPPKTVRVEVVDLSPDDRALYDKIEEEGRQIVKKLMDSGTALTNYATVLEIILRLRQICDHTSLCPNIVESGLASLKAEQASGPVASPELVEKLVQILRSGGDDECPICLCPPTAAVITICAHIFCRSCIDRVLVRDKERCPLCRQAIQRSSLIEAPPEAEEGADTQGSQNGTQKTSAKVEALVASLAAQRAADPEVKSVVFSQFTRMLTLAEGALRAQGFSFARIDGSMTAKKREDALDAFRSSDAGSPTVILLSLKAAGVGLNLVAASRVYLLDPWWSPAVEEQAIDRVHRIGQTRPVEVVRFAVSNSIEERILELQEVKRELAHTAFSKRKAEDQRAMRLRDVRLLMHL